jgi:hypothetical protein
MRWNCGAGQTSAVLKGMRSDYICETSPVTLIPELAGARRSSPELIPGFVGASPVVNAGVGLSPRRSMQTEMLWCLEYCLHENK